MANLATVTIKFDSEGSEKVKKDTNDLLTALKGLAAQFGIATTVAGAFTAAVAGLAYGTFKLSQASLKQYQDLETLIRALAIYQTSVASAAAQLQRLRTIALQPGLSLEQVAKGVLYLEAAGFSASLSERAIKAFGNALALAGKGAEDLAGVNLALGQIKSKGVISAEEINQIAERVPQVRKAIQDAFGTANTKSLQKMGITATVFVTKVINELEKLKTAPVTISSFIKNVTDTFKYTGAIIGRGISDMFNIGGTNLGTNLLFTIKSLGMEFSKVFTGIASSPAFLSLAKTFNNFLTTLRESAPYIAQNFGIIFSVFLSITNAITKIASYIINLFNKIFQDLYIGLSDATTRPFNNLRKEFERLIQIAGVVKLTFQAMFLEVGIYIDKVLSKIPGMKLKTPLEVSERNRDAAKNYAQAALNAVYQQGPTAVQKVIFGSTAALLKTVPDAFEMYADMTKMFTIPFQGITPKDLLPGGQGTSEDAKAAADDDKKKKENQLKALQEIANNTKKANELTLRDLTYGGGQLAAQGLSRVEQTSARQVSSPQLNASNDIVRGVEKMIRMYSNSNNLNFSFRRS